jgi:hypothetical protein
VYKTAECRVYCLWLAICLSGWQMAAGKESILQGNNVIAPGLASKQRNHRTKQEPPRFVIMWGAWMGHVIRDHTATCERDV